MKELVCNQSVSLKLNKLGFNEHCFFYFSLDSFSYHVDKYGVLSLIEEGELLTEDKFKYFECIKNDFKYLEAPTIEQAKNWILKKYGLYVDVMIAFSGKFSNNDNLLHFWKPSIEKITIEEDNLFLNDRMIHLFQNASAESRYDALMIAFETAIEIIEDIKK